MINFRDFLSQKKFQHELQDATVVLSNSSGQSLYLKFDKQEILKEASFTGSNDPWFTGLCALIIGKSIPELYRLTTNSFEEYFKNDQSFWDLWSERESCLWFMPLELLKASLDKFQGKDHLYLPASPLVCHCFDVREDEILKGLKTKAGMGCRTCKPELERLQKQMKASQRRYYKEMSYADWLLLADEKLQSFPYRAEWGMEVTAFKGNGIVVAYKNSFSQREEEEMAKKLQDFLGSLVDSDLSFFLRRS